MIDGDDGELILLLCITSVVTSILEAYKFESLSNLTNLYNLLVTFPAFEFNRS